MTYNQIRKLFLEYFKSKNHTIVESVSLIPNDPTLMFTVAGMVPWKGMLQGTEPLKYGPRVADVQKCLRAGGKHNDLDEVGFDGSHHTFFEMLGNWSFGDYFKSGAIEMSWELLTSVLKLDPAKLRVTTHISDDESTEIWKKLTGKDAIRLGDKDNWWSAGDTGPCGPCTEIFYDMGADILDQDKRWIEIWNNVFMQFDRDANGKLSPLPKMNVDTGGGLERWAAVLQGVRDNYDTDLFVNLINAVEEIVGVKKTPENTPSFKVIVDHMRAVGFAIADGVIPSNADRGYVIRRILRRAMRHGQILGHRGALLSRLYPALVREMGDWYPELKQNESRVIEIIQNEENSFADMLENGIKLLDKELKSTLHTPHSTLPGDVAFKLFDTYGFPLDLTQMILRDRGMDVDVAGFEKSMTEQKERSRADTRGTKTLWESKIESDNLPNTDDSAKYCVGANYCANGRENAPLQSKILAILKNGEFAPSANVGDEVEVALDKTNFYGTQGGQVGDSGTLNYSPPAGESQSASDAVGGIIANITETNRVGGIVIHKGIVSAPMTVGDMVVPLINDDVRIQITRAHTAAHLLQAALRIVLNEDVEQRGSKVSPDSVRFDFSAGRAMTAEELARVETIINDWIVADLPVIHEEMPIDDARKRGAMALFGEKYGDVVRVISVIDSTTPSANAATPSPAKGNSTLHTPHSTLVSCELCGGTHITHTGEIIRAKINKEKSIASGIRRITMSVGDLA